MKKLCFEREGAFRISLHQTSENCFMVSYGQRVKNDLTYDEAAKELGLNLLHSLTCEGKLDNGPVD